MFKIGNILRFWYNGKPRHIRVEKVKMSSGNIFFPPMVVVVTGWDYLADLPTGGYRSFMRSKMEDVELVS